jgi:hypothetical protein
MWLLAYIIILVVSLLLLREPKCFREVKERYQKLLDHVRTNDNLPEKFKVLKKRVLLTAFKKSGSELGFNINKGTEIGLCIQGTPNQVFHVLIHELAHSTVSEYDHTDNFWKNLRELRKLCTDIGIYEPVSKDEKFCGGYIRDG